MNLHVKISAVVICVLLMASCKKEKALEEENDNELITTVQLVFTEQGTGATQTATWLDPDGVGGTAPQVNTIHLNAGSTYDVNLTLLDASKNPPVNITEEVEAEGDVHRIYYEPSAGLSVTINNFDNDANAIPLGLSSVWTTAIEGTGSVRVVLRHYANGGKEATDPINSSKSSTDAEVQFEVMIMP